MIPEREEFRYGRIFYEYEYIHLVFQNKRYIGKTNFKQTHRNYLVNVKKIKELYIEDNLLILEANHKVPFSARYKAAF
ncbi:LytTR family transcriptional regulator DNA-binding domain-containing protein [Kordia sp. YSTF-M3]|uniref:LytTR family transcriptional regulator DNA-binding domain-containing protein n=1 Tax=Kordia aestuariivivens TaxID=2759037 RepID=A0ABR7Q7X1_9FLAO|nr:LytTR family transcriptional regulator DNA-binding domain-containing protein [Kordia aestuariivivens]